MDQRLARQALSEGVLYTYCAHCTIVRSSERRSGYCTVVKRPSPDIVGQRVEGQVVAVDRFLLYKHGGRAQVPGDCQSPV